MLGIAAAGAVLDVLESEPVLEDVEALGRSLMDGTSGLVTSHGLNQHIKLSGYGARHFLVFNGDDADGMILRTLFQQEALKAGILAAGWHAPSWAHTAEDVQHTLKSYDIVFGDLARWISAGTLSEHLDGEVVQPVFRKP